MNGDGTGGRVLAMDAPTAIESRLDIEGSFVRVDGFLNHRVEPELMRAAAADLADRLAPAAPDTVVTAEASGIPPGLLVAEALGVPMVYAKKTVHPPSDDVEAREVASATKGTTYWMGVRRSLVPPGARVAIVDDVLASGNAAEALGAIVRALDATVVGHAFLIEKAWLGGRARLAPSSPMTALVTVAHPEGTN